jgi:hypothetical protein
MSQRVRSKITALFEGKLNVGSDVVSNRYPGW